MKLAGSSILPIRPSHLDAVPAEQVSGQSPNLRKCQTDELAFVYGREYFVLRSGRAKIIFQIDRVDLGPAFTHLLYDAEDAPQSALKSSAFNFDPQDGFRSSALWIELGGFSFSAFGEQAEARWVNQDGVPAVEAQWWAGGLRVVERFTALTNAQAFEHTICLDGSSLAGDDLAKAKLLLPRGQYRGSEAMLVQEGRGYGSGMVITSPHTAQIDEVHGQVETEPLVVGPDKKVLLQFFRFYQFPSMGLNALVQRGAELVRGGPAAKRSTAATWAASSKIGTKDATLQDLYDKARFGLPGMIADDGTMDAGIFNYGRQWVRDTSNSALGAVHAGHFELAHDALERVLTKMIDADGATTIASEFDPADVEELDQMGELLHALKSYRDWTGDDSLIRQHRDKLIKVIERPLNPMFQDDTGMVHNHREFWERTEGLHDAYELAYQTYLVLGLRDAAELAPIMGAEDRAQRWRDEADRAHKAFLSHPTRALVADGHLIKRRNLNGDVANIIPTGEGFRPDAPLTCEKHNSLNPDASMALPIALGLVDPHSPLALKTIDCLEQLWNMRWIGGGYERYNSTSEPDTPGPWPFATAFILRAQHEAGLYDRSRRALEWLNTVQGGRTGFWFEEIPLLRSNTKACAIIPWTSGEIALIVIRYVLGVRFEGMSTVIKPALYPGSPGVSTDLRFHRGRLSIEIDGPGPIKKCYVNGKRYSARSDGSIMLPPDFSAGKIIIQT